MIEAVIILGVAFFLFFQIESLKSHLKYLERRIMFLQERDAELSIAKEDLAQKEKEIKKLEKKVLDLGKIVVDQTQMNHILQQKYEPESLVEEYRNKPLTLQDIFKTGEYLYGNK